jgi:hypothetical protein
VGDTRSTLQGKERITALALPQEESKRSGLIGSIHYELEKAGPFFEGYRAMVSFIPDEQNAANTLILWAVKFDPTRAGTVLCCGGTLLRLLMRNRMHSCLERMKSNEVNAQRMP